MGDFAQRKLVQLKQNLYCNKKVVENLSSNPDWPEKELTVDSSFSEFYAQGDARRIEGLFWFFVVAKKYAECI